MSDASARQSRDPGRGVLAGFPWLHTTPIVPALAGGVALIAAGLFLALGDSSNDDPREAAGAPAGGGAPNGTIDGGPLRLGVMLSTGADDSVGVALDEAVRLAVDEANALGGVQGEDVVIVAALLPSTPGASDPALDVQALRGLVDARISALVTGVYPGREIFDFLTAQDMATLLVTDPFSGFGLESDGEVFEGRASIGGVLGALEILASERVVARAAVLYVEGFEAFANQMTQRLVEGQGIEVIPAPALELNAPDYRELMDGVAAQDPDGVVCLCVMFTSQLFSDAEAAGLLDIPWLGVSGLQAVSDDGPRPPDFAGTRGSDRPLGDTGDAFASRYEGTFGQKPPVAHQAHAYDSAALIILAALAGDGTPASIAALIPGLSSPPGTACEFRTCYELITSGELDIDFAGASGPFDLRPDGLQSTQLIQLWTWDASGDVQDLDRVIEVVLP